MLVMSVAIVMMLMVVMMFDGSDDGNDVDGSAVLVMLMVVP